MILGGRDNDDEGVFYLFCEKTNDDDNDACSNALTHKNSQDPLPKTQTDGYLNFFPLSSLSPPTRPDPVLNASSSAS